MSIANEEEDGEVLMYISQAGLSDYYMSTGLRDSSQQEPSSNSTQMQDTDFLSTKWRKCDFTTLKVPKWKDYLEVDKKWT